MFKLFGAEINAPLRSNRLTKSNFVLVRTGRSHRNGFVLLRSARNLHLRTIVILRQSVRGAELPAAVGTLERKKRLFAAFLAFHVSLAHLSMHRDDVTVYMFL